MRVLFGIDPPAVDDDVSAPLPPLHGLLGHVQAKSLRNRPVGQGVSALQFEFT